MPSLFEQVVDCCQLAPAFARRLISEALERSGASAEEMRPQDLFRALPRLREMLGVFLEPHEVSRTIARMRTVARSSWMVFPAVDGASSSDEAAAPQALRPLEQGPAAPTLPRAATPEASYEQRTKTGG